MKQVELTFVVRDSGAGVCKQTVVSSSDYSARRILESQYGGPSRVSIFDSHEVRQPEPPRSGNR